ncbi:putative endonuclease lcl3 [Ophidiomyces ophidiicola]|uniref:Endonuclease lcl3 n=1 Tax=Ophidiomyces ophidiicola TaxID=1387563 RepID=A0ACB8V330_9EURO|nr:putative endonuclease lcl3 [Ophidiomyces ophidiicola]KAI1916332.1 putative endonuclease lcl3 [Ophidiomyces ophidiicola]KAI1930673.1 putative endonuclease lcl3 [Ophidiomyces ophidiicola]KAI1955418.1 putative endonuclease lcl3 [Ophidiomyces ophidiicola]KAI1976208.1 putative endonuclease lcl3 [Ophidiomyces ophidiicola]
MRWLFWASPPENGPNDDDDTSDVLLPSARGRAPPSSDSLISRVQSGRDTDGNSAYNATGSKRFFEAKTVVSTVLLTSGILLCIRIQRKYLRRIPEAGYVPRSFFRRRSIFGKVTSVGDGDNFRLYHTPGGRFGGWGWLRSVPTQKNDLKNKTIHVRLAGVDAPELPHFGRPGQPYSEEAHTWLTNYLLGRHVRAYVHRPDQYSRVVATVYRRRWLIFQEDVGLQMLKHGLATVYEAKTGAEFGGAELEKKYRDVEVSAKSRGKGLWQGAKGKKKATWESPREFKSRMAEEDQKRDARPTK